MFVCNWRVLANLVTFAYSYVCIPLYVQGAYWAHTVEVESTDTILEYYYCPPGYCRCTEVDGVSDVCNNIYYYYDDDDKQCVCDREGIIAS